MAEETVQGDLLQSRQDNSTKPSASEETVQDRLASQNTALNAEKVSAATGMCKPRGTHCGTYIRKGMSFEPPAPAF
ncbi:hypothetical protein H9L39_20392 [Fusarium oxysporum f. sp. albedinis]|nr:hypothetical protein H9L39_20392 [Fusarium oxysporum f. sp. albedinis]